MLKTDAEGADSAAKAYFEDEKYSAAYSKYLEAKEKFLLAKAFYLRLGKSAEASAASELGAACEDKAKKADDANFGKFTVDLYGDMAYDPPESY